MDVGMTWSCDLGRNGESDYLLKLEEKERQPMLTHVERMVYCVQESWQKFAHARLGRCLAKARLSSLPVARDTSIRAERSDV